MSLRVSHLRFHNFRSYHDFSLDDIGEMTVLVGPNAVGKTNIIEGIQLLTALESFRSATTEQLIRFGSERGLAELGLSDGERRIDMRLVLDSQGRHYLKNGKRCPRRDLVGQLPAVVFSPDDLQLVKGGPDKRRGALDALGMQVSRNYHQVKGDYEKLLRQKNRLLKGEVVPGYLASVNEVLARIGSQLMVYRLRMFGKLAALLPARHGDITASGDVLAMEYLPSFPLEDSVMDRDSIERAFIGELEKREPDEIIRKTSLVGPHRDKPLFLLNGRDAGDFASQGQQRSIAIAYKLSELDVLEQMTGQRPLLLLDDVMSELDATRRGTLTDFVHDAAQTFITTANIDYFTPQLLDRARVVNLPPE